MQTMPQRHDADDHCPADCVLGFIELGGNTVRPCSSHRAEQHERWQVGAYLPTPRWVFGLPEETEELAIV